MNRDLQYEQEVSKFSKKDAIIAICLFTYWLIFAFTVSIIRSEFSISDEEWQIPDAVIAIVNILIVFVLIKIRKQSLASIGLHKKNILPAIGIGLLFMPIMLVFRGLMPGLTNGWTLYSVGSILLSLASVTLLAVREDITFVGYIQTRLYGLVKNDFWAINLGATLFMVLHMPQQLVIGIPMGIPGFITWLAFTFFMHRAFVMLFKRYYSLVPVFMMHIANNVTAPARIWQDSDGAGTSWWGTIAFFIFIFAVQFWYSKWNRACSH